MLKCFSLRKRLNALMIEGCEVTIYTSDGHSCCGRIIEVEWFWCRIMMNNGSFYSSWLISLGAVNMLCDYGRDANQSIASSADHDDGAAGTAILK
jgi:hypothetical protein